jgi:AcrR family transcriptional regulator
MARQRQKNGKDRHQEILEAAARVITDRGLAETRISDIAERCGVSPGLILYYFESKDRLLVEALTSANDQFYLRLSREMRRMDSARQQLERLVELSVPGLLPEYERLDEWALWIEIWSAPCATPSWRRNARSSTAAGGSRSPTSSGSDAPPGSSPTARTPINSAWSSAR